ncbi:Glutamate receptor 2.9 [Dichanthelium oligosanthes]|uniref:Glutamate receptor 2.9 n=1 Tax=Dichanthelium oligosanthes TaxID=888268 RepID=A0A1E5USL7_9POAL|nr:Glutamate receptor 2.9 [Dichanthelium oligosanthes]
MEKASLVILCLFFLNFVEAQNSSKNGAGAFSVGVILDMQTLVGKMARTSISMALEDFYVIHINYSTKVALHFTDSRGDDIVVASAGESKVVPKGWQIPANGKKLRIGVLTSGYPEFIKNTQGENSGSYNDFVYQVFLKVMTSQTCAKMGLLQIFDAAVADTTIRYSRTSYVDFTLPYTESGVAMIVPVKDERKKNTWIIFKPLTTDLWFGSFAFFIYTGIVIWLLERRINNNELGGPFFRQLGIVIYLPFLADRKRVDSVLCRMVLIVWVFVLLVLTSSYTASLSSMLTVQQLQPTVTDVHDLVKRGEHVGIYNGSLMDLLVEIGFDRKKIRAYNSIDGFANALSKGSKSGGIAAVIDEVPDIKLFLAKH